MPEKPLSKDAVKDTTTNSEAEPTYHSSCSFEGSNTVKENATGTDEKKAVKKQALKNQKEEENFKRLMQRKKVPSSTLSKENGH